MSPDTWSISDSISVAAWLAGNACAVPDGHPAVAIDPSQKANRLRGWLSMKLLCLQRVVAWASKPQPAYFLVLRGDSELRVMAMAATVVPAGLALT